MSGPEASPPPAPLASAAWPGGPLASAAWPGGPLASAAWPRAPLLLVASSSRTGPAEGLIQLAAWLRTQRIDARFAGDTVREGDLAGHLEAARVPWLRQLRLSRKVRLADVIHDARHLAQWVREGSPDLLHASFAHDHLLCLWAARYAGAARENLRVVRTAHRRLDVTPGRFSLRRRLLARTDGVVVHAEAYRAALLAQGLDPARVMSIPGGVDAQVFTPGRAPSLRAGWGIPEGAPLAGMVARMKPERLHEQLLRGFALALLEVPEAYLVLVGRGEDEERLRALAAELAPGRIVFGGYRRGPALVEAYRALDVAVWLREGNDGACRGILEALACGLPLIAGDDGAPAELVTSSCGKVVDPRSPEPIAAALAALLGDLPLARKLGESARTRALEYPPERAALATLTFWRHLRTLRPL